jgi:hypothetical protein
VGSAATPCPPAPAMGGQSRAGTRAPRSTLGSCESAPCCPSAGGGANLMGLLSPAASHQGLGWGAAPAWIQPLSPGEWPAAASRNWPMTSGGDRYMDSE